MYGLQQPPAQPSPAENKKSATAAAESGSSAAERQDGLAAVTVSSRIPEFWMDKPKLWFAQFEATIFGQKLSDAAKQNLVVTKLSKSAIEQVTDLILEPPEVNKYEALKAQLLQVYEETKESEFRKLLSEMELGSQKPSQLLRRMKELARGKIAEDSLSMLWIGHLPSSVRAVLAVTEMNLNGLAVVADKIMETTKPIEVAEIQPDRNSQTDLAAQVAKLTLDVQAMQRGRTERRDTLLVHFFLLIYYVFRNKSYSVWFINLADTNLYNWYAMGYGQSKEQKENNNVVNETVINNGISDKLDTFSWLLIALVILLSLLCAYIIYRRCWKNIKTWLRREIADTNANAIPVVKIHNPLASPAGGVTNVGYS